MRTMFMCALLVTHQPVYGPIGLHRQRHHLPREFPTNFTIRHHLNAYTPYISAAMIYAHDRHPGFGHCYCVCVCVCVYVCVCKLVNYVRSF